MPVESGEVAEERLRERLADAMNETPMKEGGPASKQGNACASSFFLADGTCDGLAQV